MGSEFASLMTYAEAAKLLHRSHRQVKNYVKSKMLKKVETKEGSRLKRTQVERLAKELSEHRQPLTKEAWWKQAKELTELKREVSDLTAKLKGYYIDPMRFDGPEPANVLMEHVEVFTNMRFFRLEDMEAWIQAFMMMDDITMVQLVELTKKSTPWVPFLRLSTILLNFVEGQPSIKTSLGLQSIRARLIVSRNHLYSVAATWADTAVVSEAEKEPPPQSLSPMQFLLRRREDMRKEKAQKSKE